MSPQVQQCYYITGEADFALVVLGKDVEDFERLTHRLFFEDTLDTVELVMALEEEFDLEIADEDAEKISTVNEAVSYINANS